MTENRAAAMACALLMFLTAQAVLAQTASDTLHYLTTSTEVMTRGEIRDGAIPSENADDMAMFVQERTRLTLNYRNKGLEMQIMPQHFGIWGMKGNGTLNIQQAWIQMSSRYGLFTRIGRQELYYDDERIIGRNDWAMASYMHDAMKFGYENGHHKVHLTLAYNQNTRDGQPYTEGGQVYKSMQTLWYHSDITPVLGISLLGMNVGLQSQATEENRQEWQQVTGTYIKWHPRDFTLEGSFYYQSGHNDLAIPIDAWMMSFQSGWKVNGKWSLNAGYDRLSGEPHFYVAPEGGIGLAQLKRINGFNSLFGTRHEFYGAMDFFYVQTYYEGLTPGLQDIHAGVQWKPGSKWAVNLKYHHLATTVDIPDATSRSLGNEVESTASWRLMDDVTLTAGYSYMHGTPTMVQLKRTRENQQLQWGWLMLVVSPRIFNHKW